MTEERKHLEELVVVVEEAVKNLDIVMQKYPQTPQERLDMGKQIAVITNALEFAKDRAKTFALGWPLRTGIRETSERRL